MSVVPQTRVSNGIGRSSDSSSTLSGLPRDFKTFTVWLRLDSSDTVGSLLKKDSQHRVMSRLYTPVPILAPSPHRPMRCGGEPNAVQK